VLFLINRKAANLPATGILFSGRLPALYFRNQDRYMEAPERIDTPRTDEFDDREVQLLLEKVLEKSGFDFRKYSLFSIKRRILDILRVEQLMSVSQLREKVGEDIACLNRFILSVSVIVTSMFRDPLFFLSFRERVVPRLREYPFIRIWHAGCATGEEAYSMAILLEEEGLYDKCKIYATDINKNALRKAKEGIFPLKFMQEYTSNYINSGGKSSFSDYYLARYESAIFNQHLKRNLIFSHHNLVSDGVFNEFDIIFCRNVLIYFDPSLQTRVHELIYSSLGVNGILCLGDKETIKFTPHEEKFEELDGEMKIFRRTA
jgi:chemotaxis protein methyltransferase CheR